MVSLSTSRYDANLEMARSVGVKKSITTNTSLGVSQFLIFGSYALAFWYGTSLTAEEENYDIGRVLIVSTAMGLWKMLCNFKRIVMQVVYIIISVFSQVLAKLAVRQSLGIKELKGRYSSYLAFDITSLNSAPWIPTLINVEAKVSALFSLILFILPYNRVQLELLVREQRQVSWTTNKILARH